MIFDRLVKRAICCALTALGYERCPSSRITPNQLTFRQCKPLRSCGNLVTNRLTIIRSDGSSQHSRKYSNPGLSPNMPALSSTCLVVLVVLGYEWRSPVRKSIFHSSRARRRNIHPDQEAG